MSSIISILYFFAADVKTFLFDNLLDYLPSVHNLYL